MIEVVGLTKRYGAFEAVSDLTFSVGRGEVVGFLGPNGAGKSTTIRILAGFMGPTAGEAWVNGYSVLHSSKEARASLGYMPESCPLYLEMRVHEYLGYRGQLKGVTQGLHDRLEEVLHAAGLHDVRNVIMAQLSKGYRQRVGLADALIAAPPLLILDEPTAGLDPNQVREVRALIKRLSKQHTIFVSTHILSEVEAMCSRGVMIAKGRLVADGSLEELRALRKPSAFLVRGRDVDGALREKTSALAGVASIEWGDAEGEPATTARIRLEKSADYRALAEAVVAVWVGAGASVSELSPYSSLEEVFAQLTEPSNGPTVGS